MLYIGLFFHCRFLWKFCVVVWYVLQYQFPVSKVTQEGESCSAIKTCARDAEKYNRIIYNKLSYISLLQDHIIKI